MHNPLTASSLLIALLAALAMAASGASAQSNPVAQDTALRRELVEMGRLDQEVRRDLTPQRMQDTAIMLRMMRVDSAHTERMRAILSVHGWPGMTLVGEDGAKAAFLLVQHSPSNELQQQALSAMEGMAPGEVSRQDRALLFDRVRVRAGLPQLYGTQFSLVDGKFVADQIEDPADLDARRASAGLPPMAEYVRLMAETYHAEVVVPGWTPPAAP